jgi:eukaryotic-like serine/threonine-protein kinase
MNAARRKRIEIILAHVRTLSLDQREQFLGELYTSDATLRTEVENRLTECTSELTTTVSDTVASDTETALASNLIDSIALEVITSQPSLKNTCGLHHFLSDSEPIGPSPVDKIVGHYIGPYQVIAWIGDGNVGSVYRAIGSAELALPVAIKLLNRRMDSDLFARRFQTGISIQAVLGKHPNITAIFDAGTTEDKRPYFVMEYVHGEHINEYCNKRCLDVSSRLRLFTQVCEAVQFAHQHAIIHRDLKPANIIITADGIPKIIDFEIAKLIEPDVGNDKIAIGSETTLSIASDLLLSPKYASPEQVKGEIITIASDIYTLGVVLYQLLSGRGPYQLRSQSSAEIFQAICEQVPEKPSTSLIRRSVRWLDSSDASSVLPAFLSEKFAEPAPLSVSPLPPTPEEIATARGLTPQRLRRILAGDLDAIVLLALRKEPERRYASVEHLREDLERHLKGLPVLAHHDTLVYRAGKFIKRHAIAVATALLVIVSLIAGVLGTTTGLLRAHRERDHAKQSLHKAQQVVDRLFTLISKDRRLDQPGMNSLRAALLSDAQHFYEDFLNQRIAGRELHTDVAMAQTYIAKISSLAGSGTTAVNQFHKAVGLWEKLIKQDPDNLDYQTNLAQALDELGIVLAHLEGRFDEALDTFHQAQKIVELVTSTHPELLSLRLELGRLLQNIAELQRRQGKADEAIMSIERVVAIELQLVTDESESLEPRIALATAYITLGRIFGEQPAELLQAIAAYHQAVELFEVITQEHPELAEQSYQLASSLSDLSGLQQKIGQTEPAFNNLGQALQIFERIDLLYPGVVSYQQGLGTAYIMISDVERQRGERAEALTVAQKARGLFERLVAEHPKNVFYRRDLARSYNNLGRLQAEVGEPTEALQSFQHAVDLFESLHELEPQDSYNLACNIALCIPLIGVKKGAQGVSPELNKGDRLRRQLYGTRAIEVLRRAAHGGFLNAQTFQDNTDLNSLRARTDFQVLMKELEEKPVAIEK